LKKSRRGDSGWAGLSLLGAPPVCQLPSDGGGTEPCTGWSATERREAMNGLPPVLGLRGEERNELRDGAGEGWGGFRVSLPSMRSGGIEWDGVLQLDRSMVTCGW